MAGLMSSAKQSWSSFAAEKFPQKKSGGLSSPTPFANKTTKAVTPAAKSTSFTAGESAPATQMNATSPVVTPTASTMTKAAPATNTLTPVASQQAAASQQVGAQPAAQQTANTTSMAPAPAASTMTPTTNQQATGQETSQSNQNTTTDLSSEGSSQGSTNYTPVRMVDTRNAHESRDRRTGRGRGANQSASAKYYRKDFGWILNDSEVEAWKNYEGALTEQANRYKSEVYDPAINQYNGVVSGYESKINDSYSKAIAEVGAQTFPEVEYVPIKVGTYRVANDKYGNELPENRWTFNGKTYYIAKDNVDTFIKNLTDYRYEDKQVYEKYDLNDGGLFVGCQDKYHSAFIDSVDDYATAFTRSQENQLRAAEKNFGLEKKQAIRVLNSNRDTDVATMKAQAESKFASTRNELDTNYNTLATKYANDVAAQKKSFDGKRQNANESVQNTNIQEATAGRRAISG